MKPKGKTLAAVFAEEAARQAKAPLRPTIEVRTVTEFTLAEVVCSLCRQILPERAGAHRWLKPAHRYLYMQDPRHGDKAVCECCVEEMAEEFARVDVDAANARLAENRRRKRKRKYNLVTGRLTQREKARAVGKRRSR